MTVNHPMTAKKIMQVKMLSSDESEEETIDIPSVRLPNSFVLQTGSEI